MKNIEKGSVKYLIMLIIVISICGIIIYPLFDLAICKFVTNSKFVYSFKNYIIQPIITAIITGSLLWVVDKKSRKKD